MQKTFSNAFAESRPLTQSPDLNYNFSHADIKKEIIVKSIKSINFKK